MCIPLHPLGYLTAISAKLPTSIFLTPSKKTQINRPCARWSKISSSKKEGGESTLARNLPRGTNRKGKNTGPY